MNNETLCRLKPFLYGKLLGDATLERAKKATHNNRMKIKQKESHKEYVEQCHSKIQNFSNKLYIDRSARTYKGITKIHKAWCFKTKALPVFTELRKDWYSAEEVKILPNDLEKYFTWETLAYWYMDDGTLAQGSANYYEMFLYTNCFTEQEVDRLILILKNMGIKSASKRRDRPKSDGEPSFIIRIGSMVDEKLIIENIRQYVPECLQYKLRIP